MTTTASAAPSPQAPQNHGGAHARTNGGQGTNGATGAPTDKAHGKGANPADLFATLLALAADPAPAEGADPLAADAENNPQDALDPHAAEHDNPLAGLLFWQPPPLDQTHPDLARASATGDKAAGDATTGNPLTAAMTAATGADTRLASQEADPTTRAADTANPAATPARTSAVSWQVAATRAAQASSGANGNIGTNGTATTHNGTGHGAPAMRWSPAASATESTPWSAVRSTVTLDARFPTTAAQAAAPLGSTDDDAIPSAGAAPSGTYAGPAAVGGTGGTPQGDLSGGQGGGGNTGERSSLAATEDKPAPGSEPYPAQADDAVEVQHWGGAHGLRHASLRVGEDAGQAIDIQLALRGDELRLDIRTDDGAAREMLREQAQIALGERLQQGGLQLADVSVGSQQQERQREGHVPTVQRAPGATGGADAHPGGTPAAPAPRSTRNGLDLFV